jgi:Glyoxalase-like domain
VPGRIAWITAFLDVPADRFDATTAFWTAVTGTTLSVRRGAHGEFVTLVPVDGDAFLRAQIVAAGPGGIHLDLHTDNARGLVASAVALGAQIVDERGYVVVASPAGMTFCVVTHHGEAIRPSAHSLDGSKPALVDQVCIDVPFDQHDREVAFWAALTEWPANPSSVRSEFTVLGRPDALPLRLMLQRTGRDDPSPRARAHLDIAAGPGAAGLRDAAAEHVCHGAMFDRIEAQWITMTDPAGWPYCLTARDPSTGLLPPAGHSLVQ